jgi:L-amino acid N-acyltransferase YncA
MGLTVNFRSGSTATPLALRVSELVAESTERSRNDGMIGGPPERLKLRDGRIVDVRPLERCDRPLLEAAIIRLSDESRYLRFGTAKPRMPERELDRFVDVDHHDREALLAIDPLTGRGVAVVRYVQVPGEPGVVELAATVADDWQGIGLGTALLAELTQRARDEGHWLLRAHVLAANNRSLAMLRRAGFSGRPEAGALREYELELGGRNTTVICGVETTPVGQNAVDALRA